MTKVMVVGEWMQAELIQDPEDGSVIARCFLHRGSPECRWEQEYSDFNDAISSPDCDNHDRDMRE